MLQKRRSRSRSEDEHVDESWLLPYADMLTLLVALFIVLFAMGQVDQAKYDELRVVLSETLGGKGILDYQDSIVEDESPTEDSTISTELLSEAAKVEKSELEQLQSQLNGYIEEKALADRLQTELGASGLLITINDGILFDSGSAELRQNSHELMEQLSAMLASDPPRYIQVSGHTDNVPMAGATFESNWDLSGARAYNVMKLFLESNYLEAHQLSYTGYGEYHPVASNDTTEGREQNRRVEILVLPLENLTEVESS
ncbi:OmpA family protein [Shouchella sp. 1P09AA]|uniref:OmpA family protein n=1 Tax=Bacillaceae TaxID=186817 RepID=UPI000C08CD7E|nr:MULTISPECIES: OmpA family protein [Bacillaceae]UTR08294.1 OmpA family protein [Alkalihalobacillus sp. LMS6]